MQKIFFCLLLIALVSCQYEITTTWSLDKNGCSGTPTYISAQKSSICTPANYCNSIIAIDYSKVECGNLPSPFPGSTVYYTYTTSDCSDDPTTMTVSPLCYQTMSYVCNNGVVKETMYLNTDCSGSPLTNYSYAVGNCTSTFLGGSYKFVCGGIVNLPNFFMLLSLLAISVSFF